MLRTEFEDGVVADAFAWYATTDDYKIHFSDVDPDEFRLSMTADSIKTLVANYWDWYLDADRTQAG